MGLASTVGAVRGDAAGDDAGAGVIPDDPVVKGEGAGAGARVGAAAGAYASGDAALVIGFVFIPVPDGN